MDEADVDTYGRPLYLSVLIFVSLLSVAGNAAYAYAAPPESGASLPPGWAAAAHMIPPILLLLVTEVLATASTRFTGWGRAWALAGVVVIAAAAFTLSFDALYEVARMAKVRARLAWLVPVMLDVAIIVCTVLVLMASRQIQRDRSGQPVMDQSAPVTTVPMDQGGQEAVTPSVTTDHYGDQPVMDRTDRWAADRVEQPITDRLEQVVGVGVRQDDHEDHAVKPRVSDVTAHATTQWSVPVTATHVDDQVVADRGDRAVVADEVTTDHDGDHPLVTDHADHEVNPPVTDQGDGVVSDRSVDVATVAAAVIAARGLDVETSVIAEALGLLADGVSRRKVAERVGVGSHNTVTRWVDAACEIDPAYAEVLGRPSLAAVR